MWGQSRSTWPKAETWVSKLNMGLEWDRGLPLSPGLYIWVMRKTLATQEVLRESQASTELSGKSVEDAGKGGSCLVKALFSKT